MSATNDNLAKEVLDLCQQLQGSINEMKAVRERLRRLREEAQATMNSRRIAPVMPDKWDLSVAAKN